jgi:hypothetical protein
MAAYATISPVVPAKAGTHTPQSFNSAEEYGSRLARPAQALPGPP